jgi:chaperonin GroES
MKVPQPLGDDLIVIEEETVTNMNGVFLPQARQFRQRNAKVVAVGPGRVLPDLTRSIMSVKVGDRIAYDATSGVVLTKDGMKEYAVVSERAVLAIIGEDGE